jgi:hypothetical protein
MNLVLRVDNPLINTDAQEAQPPIIVTVNHVIEMYSP